jgi:prepilin-type N-terminal cleavage/methylation domain-containing protein
MHKNSKPKPLPKSLNTSLKNGFSLIETLIALSLASGLYLVTMNSQQFLSSYSLKLERDFFELVELSNQHELSVALLEWGDE